MKRRAPTPHGPLGAARQSGVLLHLSSLRGAHGIGDLGAEARRFVDFLAETHQRVWQVLPLGPTGYRDSPYQCFSAFAGNPLLISLDELCREGLLTEEDLGGAPPFPEESVDFGAVIDFKQPRLQKSYFRVPCSVRSKPSPLSRCTRTASGPLPGLGGAGGSAARQWGRQAIGGAHFDDGDLLERRFALEL